MVASLTARTGSEGEGGISQKGECIPASLSAMLFISVSVRPRTCVMSPRRPSNLVASNKQRGCFGGPREEPGEEEGVGPTSSG